MNGSPVPPWPVPGPGSDDDCFEPASIDFLAGHDREFGAVGAPDSDEISVRPRTATTRTSSGRLSAHPRTGHRGLMDCVDHLRTRFGEAVDSARGLLDDEGQIIADEVDIDPECRVFEAAEERAKCTTSKAFGRVLHGVQDFYAHSNWADEADPARPIGEDNPPGLNLPGPSPVLDLRSGTPPGVPADLATGCFVLRTRSRASVVRARVTHAALNKDNGLIDPVTGRATDPTTPRGMVGDNFTKAVAGAIDESRRQWRDFRSELTTRYGKDKGERMICALTHDDPVNDCRGLGVGQRHRYCPARLRHPRGRRDDRAADASPPSAGWSWLIDPPIVGTPSDSSLLSCIL